tara:strand:+ start:3202 stop:3885 length:684 start_codon:yes stop_codon:yes gene_type:complete
MSNLPANLSTLLTTLETAQATTHTPQSSDFQFLKMGKDGIWIYGAEDTEVAASSVFVIEPASYSAGFIAWDDGVLVDERMSVAGKAPVTLADLPSVHGDGWSPQVAFALLCLEGADEGVQMLFKSSSKGGRTAISELLQSIIDRGNAGKSELCPVVELGNSHYMHKKYGKIYTPVLKIVDWMDVEEGTGAPPAPVPDEAAAEPAVVITQSPTPKAETPKKRVRRSRG